MSSTLENQKFMDAQQIIHLSRWPRIILLFLLGFLTFSAAASAVIFLFSPESRELVVPLMSIAQTLLGAFAVILFVLFAEKQLSTKRLHEKTNEFLEIHVKEALSRIEIPQIEEEKTVKVELITRNQNVHGKRKDIYGANYIIQLNDFKMKLWIGINVKRISVIYFVKTDDPNSTEALKQIFKFTFGGAEKVGYHTNFEYANIKGEGIVSIWSTVFAELAILGNPSEQLFWVQDIAMMTQSFARTALRHGININPSGDPGPL